MIAEETLAAGARCGRSGRGATPTAEAEAELSLLLPGGGAHDTEVLILNPGSRGCGKRSRGAAIAAATATLAILLLGCCLIGMAAPRSRTGSLRTPSEVTALAVAPAPAPLAEEEAADAGAGEEGNNAKTWVDCKAYPNFDFKGHDVEGIEVKDAEAAIEYAGRYGYKGFAMKEGMAYMKWSQGAMPLKRGDLSPLDDTSDVVFYLCDGKYLETTRITTTTPPTVTTLPTAEVPPVVAVVVDNVNGRFVNGNADNGVAEAGVILHQWDNMEGSGQDQLWSPCESDWCADYRDRFSTSLINAQSPPQKGKKIGLFSDELGGFVVAPKQAQVLCAYPSDGGTMEKKCGDDDGPDCKPGCDAKMCTADMWWTCAFPPEMLGVMFQKYQDMSPKYNEVVVSTANWDPPTSIEAFFYVAGKKGCQACDTECEKVKKQREGFLSTFALASAQVPLLCLDTSNWSAPFQDVSPA